MKKITFLFFTLLLTITSWRSSAQWSENFDASTDLPAGWTVLNGGAANGFVVGPASENSAYSMPNSVYIDYNATAHDDYLVTPAITVTAGVNDRLTYYVKNQDPAWVESYEVKMSSTTPTATAFTTTLTPLAQAPNAWTRFAINLSPYVGQTIYVGFHATSADMFRLHFDNITNDTTPSCEPPTTLNATNITASSATLGWTSSSTVFNVEYGTTGFTQGTGTIVNGVSNPHTIGGLTAGTTYQFYVKADCGTSGTSTWVGPFSWLSVDVPGCPTLTTPANAATNVPSGTVPLAWTAPTTGGAPTNYDVYFATTPDAGTAPLGTVDNVLTINITNTSASTTYYWRVVPKNTSGQAVCTTVFSFTTSASPFVPYCGPLAFSSGVEPITLVNVAGINNVTDATVGGTPAHENFISIVGNVAQGQTYPITLKGNSDGNYTNRFVVFIDWNQNNVLNDTGEVYFGDGLLTIVNSTGVDDIQAVGNIVVPADATTGNTRMRVKKLYGTTAMADPCLGTSYGQAEDYTIHVSSAVGLADNYIDGFAMYPNPVENTLTLSALNTIDAVSVYNMLGQEVMKSIPSVTQVQLDMTHLPVGTYIVKVQAGSQLGSYNLIKQ